MKKRIGSAYDEIRNKQLDAICDDEYVNPINRRAYGLEKEQYVKVYPDANTQLHKPELPQQLQYNFDIACDKFASQLSHFVSLIQAAQLDEREINTLKWSDLFDSYSTFKLTIQYFIKLQNYRSTNIVAAISKVISSFLRFASVFSKYNNFYESGYGYLQEVNKTIINKIVEMESFLQTIQQQFQVFADPNIPEPEPEPAAAAPAEAVAAPGDFDFDYPQGYNPDAGFDDLPDYNDYDDSDDDNYYDYGNGNAPLPGISDDDDSEYYDSDDDEDDDDDDDDDDNDYAYIPHSRSALPTVITPRRPISDEEWFSPPHDLSTGFSESKGERFTTARKSPPGEVDTTFGSADGKGFTTARKSPPKDLDAASEPHSGPRNQLFSPSDEEAITEEQFVVDTQDLRTQNELLDNPIGDNEIALEFEPLPRQQTDEDNPNELMAIDNEFLKNHNISRSDIGNSKQLIYHLFHLDDSDPEQRNKYLNTHVYILDKMESLGLSPDLTIEQIINRAKENGMNSENVDEIVDNINHSKSPLMSKKGELITSLKSGFAYQSLQDRVRELRDQKYESPVKKTPQKTPGTKGQYQKAGSFDHSDGVNSIMKSAKSLGLNEDVIRDHLEQAVDSSYKNGKYDVDKINDTFEKILAGELERKGIVYMDRSDGFNTLKKSARDLGFDEKAIDDMEQKSRSFAIESAKKSGIKEIKVNNLKEIMYDNFDALVSETLSKEEYERERAEYDPAEYDKADMFIDDGEEFRPLRMMSLEHDEEVADADAGGRGLPIDSVGLKTNESSKGQPTALDRFSTKYGVNSNDLRGFWLNNDFDGMTRYLTGNRVGSHNMQLFAHHLNDEYQDANIERSFEEWFKQNILGESESSSIPSREPTARSKPVVKLPKKEAAAAAVKASLLQEDIGHKTKTTRKQQMGTITQKLDQIEKQMKEVAPEPKEAPRPVGRPKKAPPAQPAAPAPAPAPAGRKLLAYNTSLPPTDKENQNRIKGLKSVILKNASNDTSLSKYRDKYIQEHGKANWDVLFKAATG